MTEDKKSNKLEKSIEEYHTDFHNFIDLIKLSKWDGLSEKKKEEERGKMKEKVEFYLTNFKDNPKYMECLPLAAKYFGNIK